ncbi:uncharacterized protein LOC130793156 [Actinidia eriantha]|uniref:uncharacterized protein LOC130793156 n=1 Tax=Actinidia eriantha TaxID=165200 RepID=UPI0025866527|nr:uncharacterized protein LOC130793156 [Actinidia eriantha]
MNGLGPPLVYNKPLDTSSPTKNKWGEKSRAGGTLESVVKQATLFRRENLPWTAAETISCHASMTTAPPPPGTLWCRPPPQRWGKGLACAAWGARLVWDRVVVSNSRDKRPLKRAKMARVPVAHDDDSDSRSESGRDSWQLTSGSREWELGARKFTSSSMGSPENTSSDEWSTEATTNDDRDTVCHCRSKAIFVLLIFYFCNV